MHIELLFSSLARNAVELLDKHFLNTQDPLYPVAKLNHVKYLSFSRVTNNYHNIFTFTQKIKAIPV